jgi:hypothetical protein
MVASPPFRVMSPTTDNTITSPAIRFSMLTSVSNLYRVRALSCPDKDFIITA